MLDLPTQQCFAHTPRACCRAAIQFCPLCRVLPYSSSTAMQSMEARWCYLEPGLHSVGVHVIVAVSSLFKKAPCFSHLLLLRWKVSAVRLQIYKSAFDAALYKSIPAHHTPDFYTNQNNALFALHKIPHRLA